MARCCNISRICLISVPKCIISQLNVCSLGGRERKKCETTDCLIPTISRLTATLQVVFVLNGNRINLAVFANVAQLGHSLLVRRSMDEEHTRCCRF